MNLINFNTQTTIIFFILLFLWGVFLYLIYRKSKNKISIIFLFFSFLFLIIAIFWFRWSLKNNNNFENFWNILFAIDVSKSMKVADFEYGNSKYSRLESSKYLINDYLDNNINNNYWLVVFAWESLEILPFTKSNDLYKTILSWVDDNNLTKVWTDLNSVFDSILSFFKDDETIWTVVILTDGWDSIDFELLKQKIKNIKEKNLEIIIVWVWTMDWDFIPEWNDIFWNINYKIYKWEKIISTLNEKDLKNLANKYDFEYIRFESIPDMKKIWDLITKNTIKTLSMNNIDNREDYTRKLVLISFILFLIFLWWEYYEQKKK
jgi:hypothetical protein